MKRTVAMVVVGACLAGSVALRAHHSYAGFSDELVSVEGTLEEVRFANPHVILTMRGKDSAVYTVQWVAAFTLERRGMKPNDLKAGDVLVVAARRPVTQRFTSWRASRKCAVCAMVGAGSTTPAVKARLSRHLASSSQCSRPTFVRWAGPTSVSSADRRVCRCLAANKVVIEACRARPPVVVFLPPSSQGNKEDASAIGHGADRKHTSYPSISGMPISRSRVSGLKDSRLSRASRPLWTTEVVAPRAESRSLSVSAASRLSSTTRIRRGGRDFGVSNGWASVTRSFSTGSSTRNSLRPQRQHCGLPRGRRAWQQDCGRWSSRCRVLPGPVDSNDPLA